MEKMRLVNADDVKYHPYMPLGAQWIVDSVRTVDAVPVVHAHWEDNHESFVPTYRCSNCGYIRPIIAATPGNENPKQEPSNYCCNCGAKMDKEADNG